MLDLYQLETQGWLYQKNVFDIAFARKIKYEMNERILSYASIGKDKCINSEIRSDKICWLEPHDKGVATRQYFSFISSLKDQLNQSFYLGVKDYEGHFAQYEPGAFYKPHKDNLKGQNNRAVTVIVYLNENWSEDDGGQLRLHLDKPIDIQPHAGSAVIFMSHEILHEVLPAYKTRQAITGWLLK